MFFLCVFCLKPSVTLALMFDVWKFRGPTTMKLQWLGLMLKEQNSLLCLFHTRKIDIRNHLEGRKRILHNFTVRWICDSWFNAFVLCSIYFRLKGPQDCKSGLS